MRTLLLRRHLNLPFALRMLAWHGRYYLRGKGSPLSAGVYITDKCNCRCVMCSIWQKGKHDIYPREAQEKAVEALGRLGCLYYSVSGGEPTLVPDLPERLAHASRHIDYVHLVTNGLTMTDALARALGGTGIREISLSIDGTERWHNALRGRDDAFAKAWNALDLLMTHAPKVQIVVNSILTLNNLEGLRELRGRIEPLPGVRYKYLPLTRHRLFLDGGERLAELVTGPPATRLQLTEFLAGAATDRRNVNSRTFLRKAGRYLMGEGDVLREQKHCTYPYHAMEFDARGRAYACITGMGFADGIEPTEDLEDALRSAAYSRVQRKLRTCAGCGGSMMLCYYEPRLNFPLHNLVRSALSH